MNPSNQLHEPEPPCESWRLDARAPTMRNALVLARFARLAYGESLDPPGAGAEDAALLRAFPTVRLVVSGQVRGLVAGNDKDAVVAFAGTYHRDHWRDSLRYDQVLGFGGRAHGGFAEGIDRVWAHLLAGLYDTRALDKTLWLTGHSLGGALALLAAWRLHEVGFTAHCVNTFGAPAVMDRAAAEAFPVPAWSIINDGDWVPYMQWPRLEGAYIHPGQSFVLMRSGRLSAARHSASMSRRIDRFLLLESPAPPGGPFADHRMNEYIRRIIANLGIQ
jgi:hypothetical protein